MDALIVEYLGEIDVLPFKLHLPDASSEFRLGGQLLLRGGAI